MSPDDRNIQHRANHATLIAIACLVMAHKFPIDLSLTYLPAIFRENGIELSQLWILSIPLIPFWFRWAWSPIIDHNGSQRLGHRKGWILPCTVVAVIVYCLIALVEPLPANIVVLAALFTVAALFMATQEVAADGYMVENIKPQDRRLGSVYIEIGRSVAAIGIAVGLMALYDKKGWIYTMPTAALLFLLLTLPVLLRREPEKPKELQARLEQGASARFGNIVSNPKLFFAGVLLPFKDFVARPESRLIIPLIVFMGMNLKMVQATLAVFLVDLGMSLAEIGALIGLGAAGGSVVGALMGAAIMKRYDLLGSAKICLVLIAIGFLPWLFLAYSQIHSVPLVLIALTTLGMLVTPTQVLVMAARFRWASRAQAGTDFTLQASAEYVGYAIGAAIAGPMAALLGWGPFFTVAMVLSVTSLAIYIVGHHFVESCLANRGVTA
ncbi:MAG: MFS transporter [Pseudomonadota bacterium]